jgi:hypothetical protein
MLALKARTPINRLGLSQDKRLDGRPLVIGEFVAHDSTLQFGSLNHVRGATPATAIAADVVNPTGSIGAINQIDPRQSAIRKKTNIRAAPE